MNIDTFYQKLIIQKRLMSIPIPPLLGLRKNEGKIYSFLLDNTEKEVTPLLLSRSTRVCRPTVYVILDRLRKRGLVREYKINHKIFWRASHISHLAKAVQESAQFLLRSHDELAEVSRLSSVAIFSGKKSVSKVLERIFGAPSNADLYTFQSVDAEAKWAKYFTQKELSYYHQLAIKKSLVSRHILEEGIFEKAYEIFGLDLIKNYKGRGSSVHVLGRAYMKHGASIFIMGDFLYLINVEEMLVVEINDSEIARMIKNLFRFVSDFSEKIDLDTKLNSLMGKN